MTSTWVVIGIIILFLVVLFLTNDHLRCTLTFGEWTTVWEGFEMKGTGCVY